MSELIAQRESEKSVVARAAAGDREAYRVLVERYQSRVYGLVFGIVKSKEDAEDLAQEVFVKAYLCLVDFKGQAAFYTWLYRIAYNMAIDYRRKVSRRGGQASEYDELNGGASGDVLVAAGSGYVEGPHEAVIRKEQSVALHEVLAELSEEHRTAITLREVDGLSYEEIAEITGVSKGTVMSRLHYARKRLQKSLASIAPDGVGAETEIDDSALAGQPRSMLAGRESLPKIAPLKLSRMEDSSVTRSASFTAGGGASGILADRVLIK